jgi:hypothetical protein
MARPDEVGELLAAARRAVGHERVSLRVDTDLLETVYVEVEDGELVVHDRGETYWYLAVEAPRTSDATYDSWSAVVTRAAIGDSAVLLVGEESADEASFRLEARPGPADDLAAAIRDFGAAVDRVFRAHTRAHLW